MAYVAVKGGERAIDAAHAWLAEARRGNPDTPALTLEQIADKLDTLIAAQKTSAAASAGSAVQGS